MKVLFIASGNSETGIGDVVRNQAISLIDNGIDINIFPIKGRRHIGYLMNIPVLRRHLKSHSYDILHAHYSNCLIVSSLVKGNYKLGVSFMGTDLLYRKTLSQKIIFYLSRRIAERFCDFVIVKTAQMANVLKVREVDIIANGVDLNQFYPIDKKAARDYLKIDQLVKLIIFVSDPARKEKNYNLANKAVEKMAETRKDLILKVVNNKIADELRYYYNAADLLILTSCHEGGVNIIKEAMACNCPIVSTDVGDVKEVIADTKGCFLTTFDVSDVSEKAERALLFNSRTDGRKKIIERKMDSNSVALRIKNIYKYVLI